MENSKESTHPYKYSNIKKLSIKMVFKDRKW